MTTKKLPCRHVINIRRVEQLESVFPPTRRIEKRWMIRHASDTANDPEDLVDNLPAFEVRAVRPRFGDRVLNRREKFGVAREVADRLAGTVADLSMSDFKRAIAAIEKVLDFITQEETEELHQRLDAERTISESSPTSRDIPSTSHDTPHDQDEAAAAADDREANGDDHRSATAEDDGEDDGDDDARSTTREDGHSLGSDEDDWENDGPAVDKGGHRAQVDDEEEGSGSREQMEYSTDGHDEEDGVESVESDIPTPSRTTAMFLSDSSDEGQMEESKECETAQPTTSSDTTLTSHDIHPTSRDIACGGLFSESSDSSVDQVEFTIASKTRTPSRSKAKRVHQASRYAKAREAVSLVRDGVSFASFFFLENSESTTVKKLVDITSMLKIDTIATDATGKPVRPSVLRLPKKGGKVLSNVQVFHVLPIDALRAASVAVVKYQAANPGVPEREILVQIPGKGLYFTSTLNSMGRWHGAAEFAKKVKSAFRWFCEIAGYHTDEEWLEVAAPSHVQASLEALEFNSPKVDMYDFYGTSNVSDSALEAVMEGLFGSENVSCRVSVVDEREERVQRNRIEKRKGSDRLQERDAIVDVDNIQDWAAENADASWLVFPVFFSTVEHWTIVCVDVDARIIYYFDPSQHRKRELESVVKTDFMKILSGFPERFRLRYSQPFAQRYSYNCGVFVLMFLEHIIHKRVFPDPDRNLLQYLRFRYLCLGL